jgi:hypothetical protein
MIRTVRGACRAAGLVLAACSLLSCSDDDPADSTDGTPVRVVVPLEGAVSQMQLFANQTSQFVFTLQLPPEYRSVQAVELDAEGSARHVRVDGLSLISLIRARLAAGLVPSGGQGATATIRVGSDPSTVCTEGIPYGPFQVSTSTEVTPETVEATEPTLEIINSGMIVMCVSITPTVDALFSVDSVEVNVTQGSCGSPASFAGRWVGTYECGNSCGAPFGDSIELTVTQNGASASYTDDGGATFTGTVCGNLFRFERVTSGEIERGTLTLEGNNQATKRSTWRGTSPPYCGGNCVDVLTRVSGN